MGKVQRHAVNGSTVAALAIGALIVCLRGCSAQSFSVNQQLLDFGDVAVGGASNTQTVTLLNGGDAAALAAVTIQARTSSPDGQFTITGGTCTRLTGPLQTGDSCTYTVQAKPTASGTVSALLTVTGSNFADGTFTSQPVILTANALIPKLASLPDLIFGDVVVGTTSPPQDITLVNIGKVPALLSGATAGIAPVPAQFTIVGGSCFSFAAITLAPGQTCTFTITATPTMTGLTTQQFLFRGAPGSGFTIVGNFLDVNGVLPTLPPSPALNPGPTPSSPVHKSSPPLPPPKHHHHSGK